MWPVMMSAVRPICIGLIVTVFAVSCARDGGKAPAKNNARAAVKPGDKVKEAPRGTLPATPETSRVRVGDTMEQVVKARGQPKAKISMGDRALWTYADGSVDFSSNRVVGSDLPFSETAAQSARPASAAPGSSQEGQVAPPAELPAGTIRGGSLSNDKLIQDTMPAVAAKVGLLGCDKPESFQPYVVAMPEGPDGAKQWKEKWIVSGCGNKYEVSITFRLTPGGADYVIE
jgi:hypothetical protein